jgi:hypothetical protein
VDKEKPVGGTALVRVQDEKLRAALNKAIRKQIKTNGVEIFNKRCDVAYLSLQVRGHLAKAETESAPEVKAEHLNLANVKCMQGILNALELLADCVSWDERVKIKGKGYGTRRMSLVEVVRHIAVAVMADDGLLDMTNCLLEMTNDIGVKQEAFKDENGVVNPNEYFDKDKKPSKPSHDSETEVEVEEGEALAEEEAEAKKKRGH